MGCEATSTKSSSHDQCAGCVCHLPLQAEISGFIGELMKPTIFLRYSVFLRPIQYNSKKCVTCFNIYPSECNMITAGGRNL